MLLDGYAVHGQKLRLAFYIFSASGGTGSGAAMEFLRAQRFSLAVSAVPHQVFFCGITVLPRRDLLRTNQTHQRNAGRLLTQYLAELNIDLPDKAAFTTAPVFKFDAHIRIDGAAAGQGSNSTRPKENKPQDGGESRQSPSIPLPSWDALLFISNDVMPVSEGESEDSGFEGADKEANMYIAQCMFNISSAQLPIAQISDKGVVDEKNFQSRRLDPNDLRTGLNGPACVGFAAMSLAEARSEGKWVDRLFASAIALPSRKATDKGGQGDAFVQGLSICPEQNRDSYTEKVNGLISAISDKQSKGFDEAISKFAKVRLFATCPRAIFIFTSPQTGEIPSNIETRVDALMNKLCPNLVQLRTAIVRGTTTAYTATLLLETSIVNCYDMLFAFSNYLRLAFSKSDVNSGDFQKALIEILDRNDRTALTEDDLEGIMVEREVWSRTVTNYQNQSDVWERNWSLFKESQRAIKADTVSREADQHAMGHMVVTRKQVVSALNYVRYARHFDNGGPIEIPD